jgi:TetR/AcrR family acrAB operon transcriptional repressor
MEKNMRRTAEETAKTKEKILDVSLNVVAQKGYSATNLTDIAKKAGLTRGAIYHHFKNKSELFAGLADRYHKKNLKILEYYINNDVDTITKLKTGMKKYFALLEEDLKVVEFQQMHLLKQEILSSSVNINFFKNEINKHFEIIEKLIIEAKEKREINPEVDPKKFTFFLFSIVQGVLNMWLLFNMPYSLEEAIDYVNVYIDHHLKIEKDDTK